MIQGEVQAASGDENEIEVLNLREGTKRKKKPSLSRETGIR